MLRSICFVRNGLTNHLQQTFSRLSIARQMASKSSSNNDESGNDESNVDTHNFKLTEDIPPIPENIGWLGDENTQSLYKIHEIRKSFKHGMPPIMRQRYLDGPLVMRLIPIAHCTNRPFYRIAVTRLRSSLRDGFIEDLGSIDPLPNRNNQIIVGINIERIKYYLSQPILLKGKVPEILGLAGLLPVHPRTYKQSYLLREKLKTTDQLENKANTTTST